MAERWMQSAVKKPGSLRAHLHIKEGEKIPASKLAVQPGDSALTKKRKILAKTFAKFRKH